MPIYTVHNRAVWSSRDTDCRVTYITRRVGQGICRPTADETQKKHYSGKVKRHTIKTQYTTSANDPMLHMSAPVAGSMHDFALFKLDPPTFPQDLPGGDGGSGRRRTRDIADSGYSVMDTQYPDRSSRVARKRKHEKRKSTAGALAHTYPR